MAIKTIKEESLTALGNAIRAKTGSEDLLEFPNGMIDALEDLNCFSDDKLVLSGNLTNRFSYGHWDWFIETYGDKITTEKITSLNTTFLQSKIEELPFDLHILANNTGTGVFNQTFDSCVNLKRYPNCYFHKTYNGPTSVYIDGCLNDEPNMFFDEGITVAGFEYDGFSSNGFITQEPEWLFSQCDWDAIRANTKSKFGTGFPVKWSYCHKLKSLPSLPLFYSDGTGNYYSHWYGLNFTACSALQYLVLPRPGAVSYTSTPGAFSGFERLPSLKRLVFDTQANGVPYTANWKNTTLSLQNLCSLYSVATAPDFEKRVTNQEEYERLKEDAEYWSTALDYATYNHNSAVETINSLPDTSAYGTNIIKFKGASGALTDGGAINTLTEEEIAVAAAKGWTVTLV